MSLNKRAVSSEFCTTGTCPLDCSYCYIPKTEMMSELHEKIDKMIRDGKWLDRMEKVFGEQLEYIGLWGTEPLLNIDAVVQQLDEIEKRFPNLHTIKLSTSLFLDVNPLIDLINKVDEKEIKIDLQISYDSIYTEENRMRNADDILKGNLKRLLKGIEGKQYIRWKPTISIENIKDMVMNQNLNEYFNKFDEIIDFANDINDSVKFGEPLPSLVVPGKYTSEDGKVFAKYMDMFLDMDRNTTYTWRIGRLIEHADELTENPKMFTCSGGDSNFGVDMDGVHICHRTFYLNQKEYIDSVKQQEKYNNWDVSLFEEGIINMINDNYIVDENDIRFQYIMRNYHDYWKLKINQTEAMLIELAKCGQAKEYYIHDDRLRESLALFLHTAHSCPMENLLNTGVIHFIPVSLIRLWSNGAFKKLLEGYKDGLQRGK